MCDTCGCGEDHNNFTLNNISGKAPHAHLHDHNEKGHRHHHENDAHAHKTIVLEKDILSKNNLMAERNRGFLEARKICSFNMLSSPGSGKTTILEKIILNLKTLIKIYVIEGDQQTSLDAERIKAAGATAIQINTGKGCHLDAHMVNHAMKELDPTPNSVLFIENVGNMVCPAIFDLGELIRIVVTSTTEGDDKPLKYPDIFIGSHFCILNKTDLLPYLDFDPEKFTANLHKIKKEIPVLKLSAKTNEGLKDLVNYIQNIINQPDYSLLK
jgi:hydrogenase nickel incorporation protein HypB